MIPVSKYSKLLVSLLSNAETVLALYPHVHWIQAASAAVGSVLVWLVPNSTPKVETLPEVKP